MSPEETYTLEYWVDSTKFSKDELASKVRNELGDHLDGVDFQIIDNNAKHIVLRFASTEKKIDICYDKLSFTRQEAFRVEDELGNSLRAQAYSILSEIELLLRNFILQASSRELGFDWWGFVNPELREKAESNANSQVNAHQIEFTFFDQLIRIITTESQVWPQNEPVSVSSLSELFSQCNSYEEFKTEFSKLTEVFSFWNTIFAQYFDDETDWTKLEKTLLSKIVPIRNKVMHHRMLRVHELRQLHETKDEICRVIKHAKTDFTDEERRTLESTSTRLRDSLESFYHAGVQSRQYSILNSHIARGAAVPNISAYLQFPAQNITSEIMKGAMIPSVADVIAAQIRNPLAELWKTLELPSATEYLGSVVPKVDIHISWPNAVDSPLKDPVSLGSEAESDSLQQTLDSGDLNNDVGSN